MPVALSEPSLFAPTRSITTDRRRIDYTPRPELIERAGELVAELRRVELELSATLAAIDASRAHVAFGAASVEQLASRLGLAPEEARRYRDLGRAVAVQPSVGERVAMRALPTTRAAVLAPVLDGSGEPQSDLERELGVLPPWVSIGERTGTRQLRKLVRRERTKRATGEDVLDLTLHVTETTREQFERARVLASRKAGRRLTSDATFHVVVADYVQRHDPLEVTDGKRRVGPTAERPHDRYVPVGVRRDVRRRAGDCCEHPGCDETTFLEFAHRRAHRHGSGREVDDLFLLCWLHHAMVDAGDVRVVGPTADPSWVHTGLGGGGYVCSRRVPGGCEPDSDDEKRVLREMLDARSRERQQAERREREGEGGSDARGPP